MLCAGWRKCDDELPANVEERREKSGDAYSTLSVGVCCLRLLCHATMAAANEQYRIWSTGMHRSLPGIDNNNILGKVRLYLGRYPTEWGSACRRMHIAGPKMLFQFSVLMWRLRHAIFYSAINNDEKNVHSCGFPANNTLHRLLDTNSNNNYIPAAMLLHIAQNEMQIVPTIASLACGLGRLELLATEMGAKLRVVPKLKYLGDNITTIASSSLLPRALSRTSMWCAIVGSPEYVGFALSREAEQLIKRK